jgi:hypothetical protein
MKTRFLKIVSVLALATVIALVTEISAFAQSARKQQGIEGVWDARIINVDCDTGAAISITHAILMFSDGGSLTLITPDFVHSAGLGTWRRLRGPNYTAVTRFFEFNEDGSFAGTRVTTRDVTLSGNADEFTTTATDEFFNPADQLVSKGCGTATA